MSAYYNEIDPYAAHWIRNLIAAGLIADGVVDERSIEDVHPIELRKFTQCHFFAGVGVWSRALRTAGWSDDRRIWTGSCPCQPFSAAGKGAGFADERHLWPAFYHLIEQCRPECVLGEQVASKDANPWIDLVHTDMEALGYAFGAVPFPSAGVGAPHIRDRLYWLGHSTGNRSEVRQLVHGELSGQGFTERCEFGGLADPNSFGSPSNNGAQPGVLEGANESVCCRGDALRTGPTNGLWRDADWLLCRDDKWRPVEPGTFPLAHGAPARVGRLRAYGNAVNAIQAQTFIEAVMECMP